MKTLGIVQERLWHYRVPFYEALRRRLREEGIEVVLVHGQPSRHEEGRDDSGHLGWAIEIKNRSWCMGESEFLWQPCLSHVSDCDLLVVQQENRMLVNYWLLFRKKFMKQKLAFWGHGKNCQASNPNGLKERWKRLFLKSPDWWFAYTDFSKDILLRAGFPADRITVVENAIDTTESIRIFDEITEEEINELRRQYYITKEMPVGIFCSRLYREKRIDFLLQCVAQVKERVSDFHFFVIGSGPDSSIVEEYARNHGNWFHYVGPKYSREKVKFFKLAQFQLMPGPVGLHIVDSFALLTPIITTDIDCHGPEIIYLENGINGIMSENKIDAYVGEIVRFIEDKTYQERLVKGCMQARKQYTIENMAENFARGVVAAMEK